MTCYVPYHPVFKRSGDIYFLSDCSNKSQEYSFDDCVFHSLDSTIDVMCSDVRSICPMSMIVWCLSDALKKCLIWLLNQSICCLIFVILI